MLRMVTFSMVILGGLLSSGCTLVAFEAMEHVDKAVSKLAQSDCELIRIAHFEPICDTPPVAVAPEVYCYRRLGAVDCYAVRDPLDDPIVDPPVMKADKKQAIAGRF